MNKPVTIEDIAREAGVSASTVSRVLNGSKRVAEDKRALVLAAIEQHHYSPNAMARSLVRGQSMTIGVLVQDILSPFFSQIVWGIEQGLNQTAYRPMLTTTHWQAKNPEDEVYALQQLLMQRVGGVIVLAGRIPDETLLTVAARVPLVVVARQVPGLERQSLSIDNQEGAYLATNYLLGLGHRHIAHISGPSDYLDATERVAGYVQAHTQAGLPIDERLIVEGDFTAALGQTGVESLLQRGAHFSAIFAGNDQSAYGAMLGLFNHGYHIPNDVSVVGFDDQLLSAYTLPPLTTIRYPTIAMGQAAAEGVLRLIQGEDPQLPYFPMELVIRQSARRAR